MQGNFIPGNTDMRTTHESLRTLHKGMSYYIEEIKESIAVLEKVADVYAQVAENDDVAMTHIDKIMSTVFNLRKNIYRLEELCVIVKQGEINTIVGIPPDNF